MLRLENSLVSQGLLGRDEPDALECYRQYFEPFYQLRGECIAQDRLTSRCIHCNDQILSCSEAWISIERGLLRLKSTTASNAVVEFSNHLRIILALDLNYTQTCEVVESIKRPADDSARRLRNSYKGLGLRGDTIAEMLLRAAITEIWFYAGSASTTPSSKDYSVVKEAKGLYITLATALAEGQDSGSTQKPLNRSSTSLKHSGEVVFGLAMHPSCYYADYNLSSVIPLVKMWGGWLTSRQSDNGECFTATDHQFVCHGTLDVGKELEGHYGRVATNLLLRSLVPRVPWPFTPDLKQFRDVMIFRGAMLLADCQSHDNSDIASAHQITPQLVGMVDGVEDDLWSGRPLVELGRLDIFIRHMKHLFVCQPIPRHMAALYTFLYSLTSPRHNTRIRGRMSPLEAESIMCCSSPFYEDIAPPCDADRKLSLSQISSQNPLGLVLQAVLEEGLNAEEWQASIDMQVRVCYEWSCGLRPEFAKYDPVAAAIEVAPLCLAIMKRIGQLIPGPKF